jgi:hypothetical protein
MKKNLTYIFTLFCYVLLTSSVYMQNTTDGVNLFTIERNRDANQIFYNIHTTSDNLLDVNKPINIYWVKHTDNSKIEPLTWVQNKYAYGINYTSISESEVHFQFVSYAKRTMLLKKGSDGSYHVFTTVNGKEVILNKIFVQIDGGTFWFPKIPKVELHVQDPISKQRLIEIIKP